MPESWPQAGYNTQHGPVPSRVHADVDAVIGAAHDRQYWCQAEKGLTVRIIIGVGKGCYVSFDVGADGEHTFHEANGCGWVWRGKHEFGEFLDWLRRANPVGTTPARLQPGYTRPEPKPIPLPATSP